MIIRGLRSFSRAISCNREIAPIFLAKFSKHNEKQKLNSVELKTNEVISKNIGLTKFLGKVYNMTGFSFLTALGASYTVTTIPYLAAMIGSLSIGASITTLISLIAFALIPPKYQVVQYQLGQQKISYIKSVSSPLRKFLYWSSIVGMGVATSPLIGLANAVDPTIIPICLGLTASIFGGASLVALNMKKDSMLKYSHVLGGSLLGLVLLQLAGLSYGMVVGPNAFTALLFDVSNYLSIPLFTLLIMYDTHVAIKMYSKGQPDHYRITLEIFLDIWNIFIELVSLFLKKK